MTPKVIKTCHDHGAKATGGMAAAIFDSKILQKVLDSKILEISKGVDGFLVYDLEFLKDLNKLSWINNDNPKFIKIDPYDLLNIPKGKVTRRGLEKNIKVGILFISSWMTGQGTFILDGNVEDSATAEIRDELSLCKEKYVTRNFQIQNMSMSTEQYYSLLLNQLTIDLLIKLKYKCPVCFFISPENILYLVKIRKIRVPCPRSGSNTTLD